MIYADYFGWKEERLPHTILSTHTNSNFIKSGIVSGFNTAQEVYK